MMLRTIVFVAPYILVLTLLVKGNDHLKPKNPKTDTSHSDVAKVGDKCSMEAYANNMEEYNRALAKLDLADARERLTEITEMLNQLSPEERETKVKAMCYGAALMCSVHSEETKRIIAQGHGTNISQVSDIEIEKQTQKEEARCVCLRIKEGQFNFAFTEEQGVCRGDSGALCRLRGFKCADKFTCNKKGVCSKNSVSKLTSHASTVISIYIFQYFSGNVHYLQ